MAFAWLIFFLGLIGLVAGGELLVYATANLAVRLKVSQAVIATTIIAFGSSLPELLISVMAAIEGSPGLAFGNVVGSNIQNIGIVVSLAALTRPFGSDFATVKKNQLFFLGAPIVLGLLSFDQIIGRREGTVLLGLFAAFCFSAMLNAKKEQQSNHNSEQAPPLTIRAAIFDTLAIIVGLVLLIFSARGVLSGAIILAEAIGLSERVVGLTIVAVGTSLPELFISLVAAYRNRAEIIIGNILGSNIYNILAIVGTSAAIAPMEVERSAISFDLLVMMAFTLALYLLCRFMKTIGRVHAAILLICCLAYNAVLVV